MPNLVHTADKGHKYNLFFGMREGELKHISEVANGLKCNCICPACEKRLVARNAGLKKIHHFAHYESAECRYGVQTSVHMAAKLILERSQRIKVPGTSTFINKEIEKTENRFVSHGYFETIANEVYVPVESVILERKLHSFIPDVVVITKNKRLIVEIAVTHFVGRKKLDKIIASKESALEIDLSSIRNDFNFQDLEPLIVDSLENKIWLHNQYASEKARELKAQAAAGIEEKNLKEYRKRQDREEWYKAYYRPVVNRKISETYSVQQVENCPLEKREFEGLFYASVKVDCVECKHSRWLREDGKYIVCLYSYHKAAPDGDTDSKR